jgi:hypothetical protein
MQANYELADLEKEEKEGNMVRKYILIARRSTIEQKNQFLGHRLLIIM